MLCRIQRQMILIRTHICVKWRVSIAESDHDNRLRDTADSNCRKDIEVFFVSHHYPPRTIYYMICKSTSKPTFSHGDKRPQQQIEQGYSNMINLIASVSFIYDRTRQCPQQHSLPSSIDSKETVFSVNTTAIQNIAV